MKETRSAYDPKSGGTFRLNTRTNVLSFTVQNDFGYGFGVETQYPAPGSDLDTRGRAIFKTRERSRLNRAARAEAYRSCGMVRVRGSQGGEYWE